MGFQAAAVLLTEDFLSLRDNGGHGDLPSNRNDAPCDPPDPENGPHDPPSGEDDQTPSGGHGTGDRP